MEKSPYFVIPAKAGIQYFQYVMDSSSPFSRGQALRKWQEKSNFSNYDTASLFKNDKTNIYIKMLIFCHSGAERRILLLTDAGDSSLRFAALRMTDIEENSPGHSMNNT